MERSVGDWGAVRNTKKKGGVKVLAKNFQDQILGEPIVAGYLQNDVELNIKIGRVHGHTEQAVEVGVESRKLRSEGVA